MQSKLIEIENIKAEVEWTPEQVGQFLQSQHFNICRLCPKNNCYIKQLSKELFLLAAKASLSDKHHIRCYAGIISHYAKQLRDKSMQNEVNQEHVIHEQQTNNVTPSLDHLQAHLFKLMTQYSVHPCAHIATHIVHVLDNLCHHPHIELLPEQRSIYCQSLNLWRSKLLPQMVGRSEEVH